jgi:cell division protein FtsB
MSNAFWNSSDIKNITYRLSTFLYNKDNKSSSNDNDKLFSFFLNEEPNSSLQSKKNSENYINESHKIDPKTKDLEFLKNTIQQETIKSEEIKADIESNNIESKEPKVNTELINNLQLAIDALKLENGALNVNKNKNESEIKALKEQNDKLNKQIIDQTEKYKKELDIIKDEHKKRECDSQEKISTLKKENKTLSQTNQELTKKINELESLNKEYYEIISKAKTNLLTNTEKERIFIN